MKAALLKVWRWIKWPVIVIAVAYLLLVIFEAHRLSEVDKTNKVVAAIHAQKLTLADVMGKTLPPVPDQAENDATVAGIDKNNNGVRDDVELAIFKKYPDSAKVRAAQLQYAMSEQMMLTRVFNTDSWVAAVQEYSRGYACISETYPRTVLKDFIRITDMRTVEVDDMVFDTQLRRDAKDKAYDFTTSYGDLSNEPCDIDLNTLPN